MRDYLICRSLGPPVSFIVVPEVNVTAFRWSLQSKSPEALVAGTWYTVIDGGDHSAPMELVDAMKRLRTAIQREARDVAG